LRALTTVSLPSRRVLVMVQTIVWSESTDTPASESPVPEATTVSPSLHSIDASYLASGVPAAPVSATVYAPGATLVEPLSPSDAPALTTVAPTLRSNVPSSSAGLRSLTTSIVPGLRALVNVQTTSWPSITGTPESDVPVAVLTIVAPSRHSISDEYFASDVSLPPASETV
jgi:hypothetical protein